MTARIGVARAFRAGTKQAFAHSFRFGGILRQIKRKMSLRPKVSWQATAVSAAIRPMTAMS
jgi:hypothetical protein